jgi:hypothetical protein
MQTQLVTMIRWNGVVTPIPVHIYEHSESTRTEASGRGFKDTGKKVRMAQSIWSAKSVINLTAAPGKDPVTIEFRFPHTEKADFGEEFRPFAVDTKITSDMPLWMTYSKLEPNQKKLVSMSTFAAQIEGGAVSAIATAADGAGILAAALAASAAAPAVIGATMVLVGMVIAVTAAKQYRENLKARQVCLRFSCDPRTVGKIWDYESKIYSHQAIPSGVSFNQIRRFLLNGTPPTG